MLFGLQAQWRPKLRRNGIFREFLCAIVELCALKNQRLDGIAL